MTRRGKKDQCQQTDGHVSTEVLRVHATRLQPAPSHSTAQHATELRSAAPHPPQAPCTHHPSLLHPSFLLPLPLAMRAAPPHANPAHYHNHHIPRHPHLLRPQCARGRFQRIQLSLPCTDGSLQRCERGKQRPSRLNRATTLYLRDFPARVEAGLKAASAS